MRGTLAQNAYWPANAERARMKLVALAAKHTAPPLTSHTESVLQRIVPLSRVWRGDLTIQCTTLRAQPLHTSSHKSKRCQAGPLR